MVNSDLRQQGMPDRLCRKAKPESRFAAMLLGASALADPNGKLYPTLRAVMLCTVGASLLLGPQVAATAQNTGYPPLPLYWKAEDYREALARFPDLDACKEAGFLDEEIGFFELHKVFRTGEELELCHYWLFRTADNVKQAVMDYLQSVDGMNPGMTRPLGNTGRLVINGLWSTKKHGVPYGGWLRRKYIATMTYGGNLSVIADDANQVFKIQISFSSK
ncbi:MAG: hypothetical protein WAU86_13390 [Oricola sp.]